ncbi:Di-/tripeptide transporter [Lentilactobacillus hilgardii]|uniref:peptide MFS transporter n=1 Tax=Lentilactobacillus hilgardii TaxID=1588 RepID=UPI00019C5F45|nr:peptide MFS transporter [Lentilactobacillus hilgardii]EEI18393.1 amino acid/peptide transporter [Lentilactobacillus buchneri ATCC 11577]MCT3396446.1 peptide MFS transporter [Lentilactobacillus hilgardii]QIR09851.1 Di-/tripeptide transporter [Lentilactobacillus hilgardii]
MQQQGQSDQEKRADTSFFGQPRGLSTLFFTEMWERFSYYGMRAILLYYMYWSVAKGGLGFEPGLAASIMSIYGSLVYLSSVVGGFISDRILGSRRTVFYGGILIMFGHIALSMPLGSIALFVSIVLITLGTGLLKPNISEMVGDLYTEYDNRRDSGFTIFVFGINFGSFISPILVGYLGQHVNFHLGFSLAAIGMFFGLLQYIRGGKKHLPSSSLYASDPLEPEDVKKLSVKVGLGVVVFALILLLMNVMGALNIGNFITLLSVIAVATPIIYFIIIITSKKITSTERSRVIAYIPLFIAAAIFWAIEEQGSSVLALFAANQTNNSLFGFQIPASWYQSLNPFFIMLYTPFFAWLWIKLGKKQPSSPSKFSLGLMIAGLSYLFMVIPVALFGSSAKVSPFWLIGSWAIVEVAELLISPIGLSVTTKLAPKSFESQMMSMWFLADSAAQAVNSQIVKYYTPDNEVRYFTMVAIAAVIAGILLAFLIKPIKKLMEGVN